MTSFAIYEGADGKKFVGNTTQGPIIALISKESGCSVTSNARAAAAEKLLHEIGLHSQAEVIQLHAQGVSGYGPANSVNTSTHCGYCDGVAYSKPSGSKLKDNQWGFDLEIAKIPAFIATAKKHGIIVTRTYPHSTGEAQHCNMRNEPPTMIQYIIRPLRPGSKGPFYASRIKNATRMLCVITDVQGHHYLTGPAQSMTPRIVEAVKKFQHDHGQKADGVIGTSTRAQLQVSYTYRVKKNALKAKAANHG